MKTVVFDARSITRELSGLGRYSLGVLSGLAAARPPVRIIALGGDRSAIEAAGDIEIVDCDVPPLALRSQWLLPRTLDHLGADLYHAPYLFAPVLRRPRRPVRIVITVHDLIPLRYPQGVHRSLKERVRPLWNRWCSMQYRRADAIVTVSDFSRRELIDHARIEPEKVVRIYNGADAIAAAGDVSVRDAFEVRGDIISYFGRHDPYKNIAAAVRAFALLRQQNQIDATLIIGGRLDPRYPETQALARELKVEDRVVFTGYLQEPMRAALLHESSVFIFPSRYEGFGLPPLEAMAAGTPVVASNAASLPEVLGDAATLVDPDDIEGLAAGILALLRDDAHRAAHIARGFEQAAKFTWRHCAQEHIALYERLLG